MSVATGTSVEADGQRHGQRLINPAMEPAALNLFDGTDSLASNEGMAKIQVPSGAIILIST